MLSVRGLVARPPRDCARSADRGGCRRGRRARGPAGGRDPGACTRVTTATSPVVRRTSVARRIDAEQLHEAAHEVLIELGAVVALQHRQDALGRERLLVGALRPHRVVDVGDAAQHRRDVERLPLDAERIAGAVDPQVVLEGDHRREDRHLRRAPEDLGAVHRVAPHDDELLVGELVRLVEDLLRGPDLADVVHQRRQPELPQQPSLDPERPRLAHRQDRHVHHVGERVVVVVAHRGQRHQRGAVLGDRFGEPLDRLERRGHVGHAFGVGSSPTRSPPLRRRSNRADGSPPCRRRCRRSASRRR